MRGMTGIEDINVLSIFFSDSTEIDVQLMSMESNFDEKEIIKWLPGKRLISLKASSLAYLAFNA
jgi:hypothetical protein